MLGQRNRLVEQRFVAHHPAGLQAEQPVLAGIVGSSLDAGKTRQRFSVSDASPTCVDMRSSNSVRTSPVLASATRTHAVL